MPIHPTAIVDPRREIAETAEIGPYCIIGAEVEIGAAHPPDGQQLPRRPHLRSARTTSSSRTRTVGVASQDLKYKGERAETRIGDRNRIREFVTIHRGTQGGGLVTAIGSDNLLMAYAHVAHDVRIGDHVILANSVDARRPRHHRRLGGRQRRSAACTSSAASAGTPSSGRYSVVKQDVMPYSLTSQQARGRGVRREPHRPGAPRLRQGRRSRRCRPPSACSPGPGSTPRRPSSASARRCRPAPKSTSCSSSSAPAERGVVK